MFVFIEDSEQKISNNTPLRSFGTLWITEEELSALEALLLNLRIKYNCWGEIKWTNVDNNHLQLYKEVVDIFTQLEQAKFNSIIAKVPTKQELKAYHDGDRLTSDMKLIWQVIAYNYSWYKSSLCLGRELVLVADEPILETGEYKDKLIDNFTNPILMSKYVPIKSATKAHSHIAGALQLADLLTGMSLAHICNSHFPKDFTIATPNKKLRDYALSKGLELDAVFSGRPPIIVKVNNWFHLPYGKKL